MGCFVNDGDATEDMKLAENFTRNGFSEIFQGTKSAEDKMLVADPNFQKCKSSRQRKDTHYLLQAQEEEVEVLFKLLFFIFLQRNKTSLLSVSNGFKLQCTK